MSGRVPAATAQGHRFEGLNDASATDRANGDRTVRPRSRTCCLCGQTGPRKDFLSIPLGAYCRDFPACDERRGVTLSVQA